MTPNEMQRFRDQTDRIARTPFMNTFVCAECKRSKSLVGYKVRHGKRICMACAEGND